MHHTSTLNIEQVDELVLQVKKTSTGLWADPEEKTKKLAPSERFSYKTFNLQKVFSEINIDRYQECIVGSYCNIDNWDSYRSMLSSTIDLKRPSWLKSKEWNETGLDE